MSDCLNGDERLVGSCCRSKRGKMMFERRNNYEKERQKIK